MVGLSVSGFDYNIRQLTIGQGENDYEKKERAESAVAKLREKYGFSTLQRGIALEDEQTNALDIRSKKPHDL